MIRAKVAWLAVAVFAVILTVIGCSKEENAALGGGEAERAPVAANPAERFGESDGPAAGQQSKQESAKEPAQPSAKDAGGHAEVAVPADIVAPPWMEKRQAAQIESMRGARVFHDFRFTDRVEASGITFRHRIVDDAGKTYKAVHYDHGNGVAVADVDGDGRLDVYFVSQVGGNELWRNTGKGRFENMTATAGVAVDDRISVSASFADIDNDGDADLYVTSVRDGNLLFENDGSGRFRDITTASGLGHQGHSSAAIFFDYDRDGLLDVFVTNVGQYTTEQRRAASDSGGAGGESYFYDGLKDAFGGHLKPLRFERSLLFRNLGGNRFKDVSRETGLLDVSWTGDASPIDANGDGWIDLYVLNMQGHDEYYENEGGKRFVKKSREVFPRTPWGSMGIKVFDHDNDGDMDIYLTDMHSAMSQRVGPEREKSKADMQWPESFVKSGGNSIYGNAFFRNDGDGKFTEISDEIGAENYWPWGLSVGDLNADGYQDAFVASSMNYPFRYAVNSVLLNDRGERFLDSEFVLGVEPRREGRTTTVWFELDCGGADRGHENCGSHTGAVRVLGALGSRSSAIFDLDGDGDLDIVTSEFNTEPMVLVSDLAERKPDLRYLQVELVGTASNRDGFGARVTVEAGSGKFTRVHDGRTGYLSQSVVPLYFGLPAGPDVDRVRVDWPSGRSQVVDGPIELNTVLRIEEDG
jgi:hypothetical protein